MRFYFGLCLTIFIFMNNISWGQSYECDNNFEQCGTPDQSGGGGKGSVLIANTDLGDSYQNADDYDDDGVEDPYDNCMRYPNPDQLDMDGDNTGDMCDNCLEYYNPMQEDMDGDDWGDGCDDDSDGDGILNVEDGCPTQWGSTCAELDLVISDSNNIINHDNKNKITVKRQERLGINESHESCNQSRDNNLMWVLLIIMISFLFVK